MPELGTCIVYTPAVPRLHRLNPTAWLALELADGRPPNAVETEFLARTASQVSKAEARRLLAEALAMLTAAGILEATEHEGAAT